MDSTCGLFWKLAHTLWQAPGVAVEFVSVKYSLVVKKVISVEIAGGGICSFIIFYTIAYTFSIYSPCLLYTGQWHRACIYRVTSCLFPRRAGNKIGGIGKKERKKGNNYDKNYRNPFDFRPWTMGDFYILSVPFGATMT